MKWLFSESQRPLSPHGYDQLQGLTGSAFNLSSIDFVSVHSYDYAEKGILNNLPEVLNSVFAQYDKPVLQAELGINWQNGISSIGPIRTVIRFGRAYGQA